MTSPIIDVHDAEEISDTVLKSKDYISWCHDTYNDPSDLRSKVAYQLACMIMNSRLTEFFH